jgi:uncharacterized Zn ribbon protein
MKLQSLTFEKVGDINATYPYLCVYNEQDSVNPFMEIAVTDENELQYTIYSSNVNVVLSEDDWCVIRDVAVKFLPEALANGNEGR